MLSISSEPRLFGVNNSQINNFQTSFLIRPDFQFHDLFQTFVVLEGDIEGEGRVPWNATLHKKPQLIGLKINEMPKQRLQMLTPRNNSEIP